MADKLTGADAIAQVGYQREKRRSLPGMCQLARSGDTDMALVLLEWAAECLPDLELPWELAEYLGEALTRITQGEAPDIALGLKRPKAQVAPVNYLKLRRDFDMALGVQYYMEQGMTLDEAIHRIKEECRGSHREAGAVDTESMRKAYLRFRGKL